MGPLVHKLNPGQVMGLACLGLLAALLLLRRLIRFRHCRFSQLSSNKAFSQLSTNKATSENTRNL